MIKNNREEGLNVKFDTTVGLQSHDVDVDTTVSTMIPNTARRRSFVLVTESPEEEIFNRLAAIAPNTVPISSKDSRSLTKVIVTIYDDSESSSDINCANTEKSFDCVTSLAINPTSEDNFKNKNKATFQNTEKNVCCDEVNHQFNKNLSKNAVGSNTEAHIHTATKNKRDAVVEIHSNEAQYDFSSYGIQPIHLTVQEGHLEILMNLLDQGVDPDSRTSLGLSSLHIAAREGFVECIELLLSKEVQVDAKDSDFLTPLHMASYYDRVSCVELLLKNGASVNLTTHEGNTALHFASQQGNVQCVLALLKYGAKSETLNKESMNSFHLAAYNGHVNCLDILLDYRMCEIDMEELIHIAAQINDVDTVCMLLKRGVNVNALNSDKLSAIHICAVSGNLECLKVVLKNGADVDQKGECGYTPLALAVEENEMKCIECLIEHSADIHIKNDNGYNALHIAAEVGHVECVKILLKYGANVNEVCECDQEMNRITAKQLAERNKHIQCLQLLSEEPELDDNLLCNNDINAN